jgi:diadenosine tetraphosphate (Ap4A) HIT family hydrolase
LHELPDEYLHDVLPIAKRIALAQGVPNYNVLQNNGRIAHQVNYVAYTPCSILPKPFSIPQEVAHVHFHVIPKPSASAEEGLVIGWPAKPMDKEELQKIFDELKEKLGAPESAL